MNVSLPDELKAFVDRQVGERGYASSSEYLRELLRREQDRQNLRRLLVEGLQSGPSREVDLTSYHSELLAKAHRGAFPPSSEAALPAGRRRAAPR